MSYYSMEDLKQARSMDLFTYLSYYDPGNLKHISGNVYCTVDHDSLVISNGKWCCISQGFGGRSALDYLIKVQGYTFRQAMEKILGERPVPSISVTVPEPKKEFVMPPVKDSTGHVEAYLKNRGIDKEISRWCTGRILS